MAVYVIAIGAAVLLLVVCYRALGGAQQHPPSPATLIESARATLEGNLATLEELIAGPQGNPVAGSDDHLREGRRAAATLQQQVDMLPRSHPGEDAHARVLALLSAAAEDVHWAWRLAAAPGWSDNPGLVTAVSALQHHAALCAQEAASAPAVGPVAEPGQRA